jgi:PAS domain S-box-containing protein
MADPFGANQEPTEINSDLNQKIAVRMDNVLNRIILIFSILAGIGLIATLLFYKKTMGSIIIILALLATMIAAKLLIKRGYVRVSGIFTVTVVWILFAFLVLLGGGLGNINVIFFISLTVIAGLLFGERATILVAAAGIATGFGLALLDIFGYLPPPYFLHSPLGDLVQLIFALVVTVSALNLALRDREQALSMATQQLSDRLEAEKALRKSEERYRTLIENANEAILVLQDGKVKFVNSKAIESFGYSEREFLSTPVFELIHPEERALVMERYLQRIKGDIMPTRHTYRMIHKNGRIFWIEISSVLIDWDGQPATLNLITDITARKQAEGEKRRLEERLHRAEKMEALGQLAGGVAHDLNNVLGVLSGYSELLMIEIPEGQRSRNHVEKILQSTEKGAAIIQDLLTLARRGVTTSEVVNLNQIASGFLQAPVFEKMKDFHPHVTFSTDFDPHLLNIKGSSVHLEKTLMNLVSNAAEAITGTGAVTICTENRYLDKAIEGYDEVKEGDYAVLSVSDTGMGIPPEHQGKIFEPFYTRKMMGRSGTGLGLSIVWGTVKDLNGYIDVQTKVGEGTTFTLYFPVTRDELTAPQQKKPLEQYQGNGELVLVVDDIAEQRDVASGLLKKLGYEVHTVSGGEEAVEYLKKNRADILLLDMIMEPGIDGLETYRRILEISPRQKTILVSGFSETDRVRMAQRLGAGAYIRKPYVMEKIGLAIRDELRR